MSLRSLGHRCGCDVTVSRSMDQAAAKGGRTATTDAAENCRGVVATLLVFPPASSDDTGVIATLASLCTSGNER